MRRNPEAVRPLRRATGAALSVETRRRRLWRRWGWPRGAGKAEWFLGVDLRLASDAWIARAYALPRRPRSGPGSAKACAYLAAIEALRPWAAMERAVHARSAAGRG